jgi:probable phosphoglycerate mutase
MGRRLVVEADGGSRGNPGPAGYGALVRDGATGEVLTEVAESIGRATNNVAEYRGLVAGLQAACAIDAQAVLEARMDSKLVVEQMSGRWQIKHPDLRPLARQARDAFPPQRVRYTWVPRARNTAADRLANEAMDAAARGQPWRRAVPPVTPPVAPAAEPGAKTPERRVGWAADLGTPTTLLLLRHGETTYSVDKRFSGVRSDPELTDRGHDQAARAGRALVAYGDIAAVVTSPLRRCRQTTDAVVGALPRVPVRIDDDLRECDFGAWEGHTFAQVQQGWPEELAAWLSSTSIAAPEGEAFEAVARRVRRARDRVVQEYPARTVVLVTHVTPVKTVVRLALEAPPHAVFRMELALASLSEVSYFADGATALRRFNDTAHLSG